MFEYNNVASLWFQDYYYIFTTKWQVELCAYSLVSVTLITHRHIFQFSFLYFSLFQNLVALKLYIYIYIHTYTYTYIHTYMHAYTHIYIYGNSALCPCQMWLVGKNYTYWTTLLTFKSTVRRKLVEIHRKLPSLGLNNLSFRWPQWGLNKRSPFCRRFSKAFLMKMFTLAFAMIFPAFPIQDKLALVQIIA